MPLSKCLFCFTILIPLTTRYEEKVTAKSPGGGEKKKTKLTHKYIYILKKAYVLVKHSITAKLAYFI